MKLLNWFGVTLAAGKDCYASGNEGVGALLAPKRAVIFLDVLF